MNSPDVRSPQWDNPSRSTESDARGEDTAASFPEKARPSTRHHLSSVQIMAWTLANWGFQLPDGSAYREEAIKLYREDMHDRIELLFADLDEQNARIRAALCATD